MGKNTSEYVLKGIFLGLLLFVALKVPDASGVGRVLLCTLGGLAVALILAAWSKFREGYRVQGRLPAFLLFLLLESPTLVYAGILGGMLVGAYLAIAVRESKDGARSSAFWWVGRSWEWRSAGYGKCGESRCVCF